MDFLLEAHFPDLKRDPVIRYDLNKKIATNSLNSKYKGWINEDRLKKALASFNAKKSPGRDGLKPVIFDYFPPNLTQHLIMIYKAAIGLIVYSFPLEGNPCHFYPQIRQR